MSNGTTDTHYSLVSGPAYSNVTYPSSTYVVDNSPHNNSFPIPPWVPNDAVGTAGGSMWISGPVTPLSYNTSQPDGVYDYQTTFTIPNYDNPLTGLITGKLTADDQVEVKLNGTTVVSLTPDQGYANFYNFSITSGFVSGTNTLDFLVHNTHESVEGLRVNMSGSVVPEPSSMILMGLGALGIIGVARSRRSAR